MRARKYEMRARAQAYQATRDRILQATFALHGTKGVAATNFSDVAAGAGVAPATVLRHFPTMDDLVTACGAHVWQWLALPDPDEAFKGIDAFADRLGHLVEEVCGIYARGALPLAGARQERGAVPAIDALLRRLDAKLDELVRAALSPFHPTEREVDLALTLLDFGVWQSLRERGLDEVSELRMLLGCAFDRSR